MKKLIALPVLFLLFFISCKRNTDINESHPNSGIDKRVQKLASLAVIESFDLKDIKFNETESRLVKMKACKSLLGKDDRTIEIYEPDPADEFYNFTLNLTIGKGETSCFVYRYNNHNHRDILLLNDNRAWFDIDMEFIEQKEINFKGKLIPVKKYFKHIKGVQHAPYENFFVNDSLGIIMGNGMWYGGPLVYCYDTENLDELHKNIIKDSVFFEFKTVHVLR